MSRVTGASEVRENFRKSLGRIRGSMTEETVTKILIVAAGYASAMTPVATSALINSQYRNVSITINGARGEVGYGANYAEHVHNAPGALLGTGTPRYPARLGTVWGPNAEPEFLTKAFERDGRSDIEALIRESYRI